MNFELDIHIRTHSIVFPFEVERERERERERMCLQIFECMFDSKSGGRVGVCIALLLSFGTIGGFAWVR